MADLLDALIQGYQNDASIPDTAAAAAMPSVPPAANVPAPFDVTSILAGGTAPAAMPKGDTSKVLGLMLLNLAAGLSSPKRYGESSLGHGLGALNQSVQYGMAEKRRIADQEAEDLFRARKLAAADEELKSTKLRSVQTAQDIKIKQDRAPLELSVLQESLSRAKTENEARNVETRLLKLKERYADEMAQAELAGKRAKNSTEQAEADERRAHARYYDDLIKGRIEEARIKADALKRERWSVTPGGLPGDPRTAINALSGETRELPMSASDAYDFAKREVEALKKVGLLKGEKEDAAIARITRERMSGRTIASGAQGADQTPAKAAPAASTSGGSTGNAELDKALNALSSSGVGTVVWQDPASGQIQVWRGNGRNMAPKISATYKNMEEYKASKNAPAATAPTGVGRAPALIINGLPQQLPPIQRGPPQYSFPDKQ